MALSVAGNGLNLTEPNALGCEPKDCAVSHDLDARIGAVNTVLD